MSIQQKLLATVKDAGDRPGERNLVLVDLSDLPCLSPGGVTPLVANQLAGSGIAKPKPLRCRLRQEGLADTMRASDKHCHS